MKTIVFRKKRLVYLLLLIVAFLFVLNAHSTTVYASTMTNPIISTTPLTEMDDLELVNFVMQNGIDVPEDLIDSVEFGSAIKDIIQASPRSSYSFTITQDLAKEIQDLIDVYQENPQVFLQDGMSQSDQFSIMSVASHTLENNLVMHNGSWSSTGGDWSSSYSNYNCYSFAIDKTNERYRYPGQHSGVSMVYNYMSLYSISQMATFVKNDLDALGGYGDVSVYSSEPSNIQFWQTLICIRKGASDYHFMKYDKSTQAWHHKPGGTAPLKYLHHPEDIIWVTEYSNNGVCYNADDQLAMGYSLTTYTSAVYYIVYGEHPFTTSTTGLPSNQIAITGVKSSVTLTDSITIPEFLNSRTVTKIGSYAFSGQTQLSQVSIPSSITHIGSDVFQNSNNAPIYLEGRTSAPNTFDINWNSSGNPVYLNGNLCTHTSTTLMSINYTQHGHLCNTCRTFVSESNHNHNVEHIPLGTAPSGIAVHSSYCRCGHSVTVPCVSKVPHLPGDTVICTYCGQEFTNPLFMITLPNGESFVSNAPFTYDMFKQLAEHLEISYEYADFVLSTRSSTIDYEYDINLASILPSRKETLYECCE
mgnify:CR=1 FL=1